MSDQIETFFKKNGAIGLILAIGPDGARFNEIKDQVAVSHDTVSNRIDEARNFGLIETEAVSEVGTAFTNRLTEPGKICYRGMNQLGLVEAHTEYVNAVEKYEKLSKEYTQQVDDEAKWLDWISEGDIREDSLMTKFAGEGDNYIPDISIYPDLVKKALQQQSVEPLQDIDNKDYWLWRVIRYPPEPKDVDFPHSQYNYENDSDSEE